MSRPHYDGTAANWREVYQSADPFGQRMQRRRDAVVAAVQRRLGDHRALILDAGCGTGEVARLLAAKGHDVVGLDSSAEMVCEARSSGVSLDEPPFYLRGNVESLPFESARFAVVVCIGVLGYILPRGRRMRPEDAALPALTELVRVLKPEGFLFITAPNLIRLHWILDPLQLWRALKHRSRLRTLLDGGAGEGATAKDATVEPWRTWRWTPFQLRRLLARRRLKIVDWCGIGFGPFSILGRSVFSSARSVKISRWLERIARQSGLRFLNQLAATWLITLAP